MEEVVAVATEAEVDNVATIMVEVAIKAVARAFKAVAMAIMIVAMAIMDEVAFKVVVVATRIGITGMVIGTRRITTTTEINRIKTATCRTSSSMAQRVVVARSA